MFIVAVLVSLISFVTQTYVVGTQGEPSHLMLTLMDYEENN